MTATYRHRYGAVAILGAMVLCVGLLTVAVVDMMHRKPKTTPATKAKIATLNDEVATIKAHLGIEESK